ncbi:enoyl-CoA hydratase/isomerase family protein [Nocardia africana]
MTRSSSSHPVDTPPVLLDIADTIAHIVLNRPHQSNAIDMAMAHAFADAVAQIERTPQISLVVIRAEGRNFCAGGDVAAMAAAEEIGEFIAELAQQMHAGLLALSELSIPVLAVVQGAAAGGGLGFVLAADIVVCTETARFVTAYSGVGLSPDCGVSYWLPKKIGMGRATQMMLTNRVVDAETAWEWGLVSHILPTTELDEQLRALITELGSAAAGALGQARRLLRTSPARSLREHLDDEAATIARQAVGTPARTRISSLFTSS